MKINLDKFGSTYYFQSNFCEKTEFYYSHIFTNKHKNYAKVIFLEDFLNNEYVPIGLINLKGDISFLSFNDFQKIQKFKLYNIDSNIRVQLSFYFSKYNWNFFKLNSNSLELSDNGRFLDLNYSKRFKYDLEFEIKKIEKLFKSLKY